MISVYNIDFPTQSDFFRLLGYTRPLAKKQINKQYGTLENVAKSRLKANTDDQAREMLQALIDKSKNIDYVKECYKVAWKMLDAERQEIIVQTIASVHNLDVSELKKKMGL